MELSITADRSDVGKNIIYSPSNRTYSVASIGGWYPSVIYYCPFCGAKLPEDLYDKKYEIIKAELGSEYLPDSDGNPPKKELPPEFRTEEWWKKRGL